MKKFLWSAGLSMGLSIVLAATVAAETRFLADMDDMPVAPGLQEIEAERLVFDKAEGRILRTAASGLMSPKEVRDFYTTSLPALGWQLKDAEPRYLMFDREHERLEISIEGTRPVLVRYALQPRSGIGAE